MEEKKTQIALAPIEALRLKEGEIIYEIGKSSPLKVTNVSNPSFNIPERNEGLLSKLEEPLKNFLGEIIISFKGDKDFNAATYRLYSKVPADC